VYDQHDDREQRNLEPGNEQEEVASQSAHAPNLIRASSPHPAAPASGAEQPLSGCKNGV
jgi:hypothetical protein